MSKRRRRLDKKLHARCQEEVLFGAIRSPYWRDLLLGISEGNVVRIDEAFAAGRDDDASRIIRRFRLKFDLALDVSNESGDPNPVEGAIVFKLEAVNYPSVGVYVEAYPESVGASDVCGGDDPSPVRPVGQ